MPPKKKVCLVRWVEEDSVGLVPIENCRKQQRPDVGTIAEFRYKKTYYDAEVLKVSDDRQLLMKLLDNLVKQKITPDDVLHQDSQVDSTTEDSCSPVKVQRKKRKHPSRLNAAKRRALELFQTPSPVISCSVNHNIVSHSTFDSIQKTVLGSQPKANKEEHEDLYIDEDDLYYSDDNEDIVELTPPFTPVSVNRAPVKLTPPLTPASTSGEPVKNFPLTPSNGSRVPVKLTPPLTPASTSRAPVKLSPPLTPASRALKKGPKRDTPRKVLCQQQHHQQTNNEDEGYPSNDSSVLVHKVEPSRVELVRGYGIFLSQPQLDAAISQGSTNPTKLMRTLLSCFFTPAVLAASTACGTRSMKPALDSQILTACIKFVQSKFPTCTKSTLIDATNDKCANFRRGRK